MSSFKESGLIEFTTDILIGLQLPNHTSEEDKLKLMRCDERFIEVVIFKNREGRVEEKTSLIFDVKHSYFH